MNYLKPSEIKKGMQVRVVANDGIFDHILYVRSAYNGFFMLDSAIVGRQCIGWHDLNNGSVRIYAVI
jgi:hypothetical protein